MSMLAKKLLIVDDEVAIQTTLAEAFQQAGYVVRVASDGFTAGRAAGCAVVGSEHAGDVGV
jgi:DNA-binding response OmpR family regulator